MHDPGLQSLRRASRVAIVVPLVFAFFLNGVDNPVAALFAGFGSFAFLGFADFGGAARPRTRAYLVLVAVGALLVVIGTLVSNQPLLAALIGVAVATVARFAGCFGGYFSASVSPVILAYVLAASVPAPTDAISDRLLGWLVAGLVSTLAALVLWPRRERMLIHEAAAHAAGAVATALATLEDGGDDPATALAATDDAIAKLVAAASVPRRPAGPSAHDAALAFLVDQLERAAILVRTASKQVAPDPLTVELATVAETAFREIDRMMSEGTVSDRLDSLVRSCLDAKRAVISQAVDELLRGEDADGVLEEIDACFPERLLLLLAASSLANAAVVVAGRGPSGDAVTIPLEVALTSGARGTISRLRELVEANAVWTSDWAQESLRAGVAVGVAIFIAGELRLDHGFWVVLGTMSVLRSNAFATGRTALEASAGTALGFAISALFLALVGFDNTALWILVVLTFFLSAYTPQVVGFVAGQVCFTIAVVALFNLIQPQGWQTGLVRFENILIGSGVSAVVALCFWPRRASVGLRANVSDLYGRLGHALSLGLAHTTAGEPVHAAELRAQASYVQYLSETAREPDGRRPWAALLADAAQIRFAIETLERHRGVIRFETCGPTRSAFRDALAEVTGVLDATAAVLHDPDQPARTPADVAAITAATRTPVRNCLEQHAHEAGPEGPLAAGLDAALVRDLLVEVTALADAALVAAPTVPKG